MISNLLGTKVFPLSTDWQKSLERFQANLTRLLEEEDQQLTLKILELVGTVLSIDNNQRKKMCIDYIYMVSNVMMSLLFVPK